MRLGRKYSDNLFSLKHSLVLSNNLPDQMRPSLRPLLLVSPPLLDSVSLLESGLDELAKHLLSNKTYRHPSPLPPQKKKHTHTHTHTTTTTTITGIGLSGALTVGNAAPSLCVPTYV